MTTAQDVTRRDVIADYGIVGETPEPDLEGLVQLAATLCGVSTAVINIIDDRFQHQIAAVGFAPSVCSRDDSMCAVVFQDEGHIVVPDARVDPRFASNPFVTGAVARVRFYASSPLVTPDGVPIGTLCVFDEERGELSDQTSRSLALLAHQVVDVLELRRLTRALGESNEHLESFAGQLSHDLRNPLAALSGFIELAAMSPELAHAPHAAMALSKAEAAASRMNVMIADLLAYARIGGAEPRREDVPLEDVVRVVLDDLDAALRESGAQIVVDADVIVRGDQTLLRVLLQNLVANAIKFSHAAGKKPRIEILAEKVTGGSRVSVDDNGPGIPVEARDRVFGLLERATMDEVPGLGIGLSTCRRVVEVLGGRIGVSDSPSGGARVWFFLPDEEASR